MQSWKAHKKKPHKQPKTNPNPPLKKVVDGVEGGKSERTSYP